MYQQLIKKFGDFMLNMDLYTIEEKEDILKEFKKEFRELEAGICAVKI